VCLTYLFFLFNISVSPKHRAIPCQVLPFKCCVRAVVEM
jgi:hypothetical protein